MYSFSSDMESYLFVSEKVFFVVFFIFKVVLQLKTVKNGTKILN